MNKYKDAALPPGAMPIIDRPITIKIEKKEDKVDKKKEEEGGKSSTVKKN